MVCKDECFGLVEHPGDFTSGFAECDWGLAGAYFIGNLLLGGGILLCFVLSGVFSMNKTK